MTTNHQKGKMKKILATLAMLIAGLAHAGPNDIVLNQRLPTDNGTIQRFMISSPVGTDCLFYFNNSAGTPTPLPYCAQVGSGLSISGGVISATPQAGQVNADWNATSGAAQILNKPVLFSGAYADLTGRPALFSGSYADLTGKPSLFSGSYLDLTNRPTFAAVATTGDYNSLINRPTIPAAPLARVFSTRTPALNTCYQLSAARDVQVSYSIDVTTTLTLLGGARGSVYLRTYADSACATGQQTLTSGSSGLPAALSVAVGLQNFGSVALLATVPAGLWVRIETVNDLNTPTFTARPGQEVAL